MYDNFLSQIDILSTMDSYERSQIADVIKSKKFKKGEYVIREGDHGDTFYFIESGQAIATQQQGQEQVTVYEYQKNAYFGELSLLKD